MKITTLEEVLAKYALVSRSVEVNIDKTHTTYYGEVASIVKRGEVADIELAKVKRLSSDDRTDKENFVISVAANNIGLSKDGLLLFFSLLNDVQGSGNGHIRLPQQETSLLEATLAANASAAIQQLGKKHVEARSDL